MFPLSQAVWEKKQNGFFTLYKEKHMANTQPQLTKTTAVSTFVIKTRWAFVAIILMRRFGILRNVGEITFWKKKLSFKYKKHTQDFPVKTKKKCRWRSLTLFARSFRSLLTDSSFNFFFFLLRQLSFFSCSKQKKSPENGKWLFAVVDGLSEPGKCLRKEIAGGSVARFFVCSKLLSKS